MNLIS